MLVRSIERSIPITCSLDAATADPISEGDQVALRDDAGRLLGYLTVAQKYSQDKRKQATTVFGTEDVAHPGVKAMMDSGEICLAGKIDVVTPRHDPMSRGPMRRHRDLRPVPAAPQLRSEATGGAPPTPRRAP